MIRLPYVAVHMEFEREEQQIVYRQRVMAYFRAIKTIFELNKQTEQPAIALQINRL